MQKSIVITITFLLFLFSATAQQPEDKSVLQKQREQLRKEIEETEKALNETRKTAKVNIGQLSLINKKVNLQVNVIGNINDEIREKLLILQMTFAYR